MPAVGIVLVLIGLWFLVRTFAGGLGANVGRSKSYAL